jgi:hypothetical protein
MADSDTIELFPFGLPDVRKGAEARAKSMVILIRWTVVFLCSHLIIHRVESTISRDLLTLLVAFYMRTNLAWYSIKEELFRRPAFPKFAIGVRYFRHHHFADRQWQSRQRVLPDVFPLIIICCFFKNTNNRCVDLDPSAGGLRRTAFS